MKIGNILYWVGSIGVALTGVIGIPAGRDILSKWIYSLYPEKLPDIGSLIDMRYREVIDLDEYSKIALQLGYNTEWMDLIYKIGTQLLTSGDLIVALRRGIITEDIFKEKMSAIHIENTDVDIYKKVAEFFPSPSDLVTFAVREVYTPAIRDAFGMDEDRPEKFIEEAGKAGLPVEQAENFWAAHWILPSPLQGFRMFHRDIINEDDLKMLLKALDIMPFWRDKMIQLSHNPLTRVDVRRMYGLNVLNEDGVHKAYKDIGYSEDNAALMTDFTTKFQNDENKGITRGSVVSAYKKGAITIEDLKSYLETLRYSETVINFWVSTSEHTKIMDAVDAEIDLQMQIYSEGLINKDQLRQELNSMSLPATYQDEILIKADLKKRRKAKLPSKEDLVKWLTGNIITQPDFNSKMSDIGYRESDILLYITASAKKEV